ncbi:MAG TPA: dihydroorotase [Candidatus Nanopelagicaceae bacterium]|nr:dihydroorotase [Candidatus Nanopelagicaceae bacterium]
MKELLLRKVRIVDPVGGKDRDSYDLLIRDGIVAEMASKLVLPAGGVVLERPGSVVSPAFLDLHCHLREPGQPWKERIANATAAAAAGGFGAICAMANLQPPLDTEPRLRQARSKNRSWGRIPILQFAACSTGLRGQELVDMEGLVAAGAAGFSDDGRHGCDQRILAEGLARAHSLGRLVAIHPEDERIVAMANEWSGSDPTAWSLRPAEAEEAAVTSAIAALRDAEVGRLHLQHLTTATSVTLVRQAKSEGLALTAEVTPHHLMLSGFLRDPDVPGLNLTCNPPLRTEADRAALWEGLLDGTIDAIASDHAPHEVPTDPLQRRPPGFSGVQAVLSVVLGHQDSGSHLTRIVAALSAGPLRVLGAAAEGLPSTGIQVGEPAHLTWFDPAGRWTPDRSSWLSLGTNTPFWHQQLRGTVLATFSRGRAVYISRGLGAEIELD